MSQPALTLVLSLALLAAPFNSRVLAKDGSATAEQIAAWTAQLEADDYATREKATAKLVEAGKAAIPVIEKAITTGGPETGVRVISILGKHYKSDDEGTRNAATAALKRIAGDGTQLGASAKGILAPAEDKKAPGAQAGTVTSVQIGGVGGVVQVGGAVVQINGGQVIQFGGAGGAVTFTVQAVAGGPQGTSVKVSSLNGVKDITVTEGGKTTKIREQANGALEVEVTEQVDGKPKTTKIQAKNTEEIKKNHPKIHELYVKHSKSAKP